MKKFSILLVSVLTLGLTLTSCSGDDDSVGSIEGKWNFSKIKYTINGVASPEEDYEDNEPGCNKDYVEFLESGTYTEGDYSGSECELYSESGTWTQSGNQVSSIIDGELESFQILSVSETTLKVKDTEEFEEGTVTVIITLTKA